MSRTLVAFLLLAACTATPHPASQPPPPRPALVSTAESSHWMRTGSYQEALALCHDFAVADARVSCTELGRTGEGRLIVALRISAPSARSRPTIYIQAGIHAGEIE